MKDLMKKEFLFGLRNSKLLIISITYFFFAFSVPVMVKVLLPMVLKSQFPGMSDSDIALMIDISQMGSMANYMSNIFEVGLIIFSFTLSGLMASEIKDNTLVLPICSGRKFESILFSKLFVFGLILVVTSLLSMLTTYAYSGLIFGFDIGLGTVLKSSLLDGLYMIFVLSLILVYGTFLKKPIATGLLTIGTIYATSILGSMLKISKFLPSGLSVEANQFRALVDSNTIIPVVVTVLIIILLQLVTLYKLKHMEWNQR
jgi:ABC-2 type transport system permease protein